MEKFFGRIFLGGFFERIFWEEFFGRIFLGGILWEKFFVYIGIDLFVKILVFVKILPQWRRKKFRSLEKRGKLIALKNWTNNYVTKF